MLPCRRDASSRRSRHGARRRAENDRRSAVPRDGAVSQAAGDRPVPRRAGGTGHGPAGRRDPRSKTRGKDRRGLEPGAVRADPRPVARARRARRGPRRSGRDRRRRAVPNGSCATWRSWPPAPSRCRSIRRSPPRKPSTSSRTPPRASRSCRRALQLDKLQEIRHLVPAIEALVVMEPAAAGASVMTLDERGAAGTRADGGGVGRRPRLPRHGARGPSRRPGHHHLHVGDDRRAQGGDAHAREPRRESARGGHGARRLPGRRRAVVPPAQPRLRADGLVHLSVYRRHDHLRRVVRHARPRHRARPADGDHGRAARVRENAGAHSREGAGRVGGQGGGVPLVDRRRAGAGPRDAPRQVASGR